MNRLRFVLRKAFGTINEPGEALLAMWFFLGITAMYGFDLYYGRPIFEHVDDFGLFALYLLSIAILYRTIRKYVRLSISKPA